MNSTIEQLAPPGSIEIAKSAQPSTITKISIIIPLCNEREGLGLLLERLARFRETSALKSALEFVFVDDGSSDGTSQELINLIGERNDCCVVNHEANQGIAAAIKSGLMQSTGDCIVSIDSDGSYELELLPQMLKQFDSSVDIIVASPYHPRGRVEKVSAWRIALSKCASRLYRAVMRQKLYCYTSCFRVYRSESCKNIETQYSRFVGIPEFLWRAEIAGLKIIEYPATLRPRLIGKSKMKLFRAMVGHFILLSRIASNRIVNSVRLPRTQARAKPEIS